LLAKQLIHQTDLPLTDVALASGFGSVRRFNETFQCLYRRPPGALRRRRTAGEPGPDIALLLPYRPPYDWGAMLDFLALRAIPGVESVDRGSYRRTVRIGDDTGSISVTDAPAQQALRVSIRFS